MGNKSPSYKTLIPSDDPKRNPRTNLLAADEAAYDASISLGDPVQTTDAFTNVMARTGAGTQNLIEGTVYTRSQINNNYQLLNNLYRTNWLVQNIVATIPEDVTKKWFRVTTEMDPKKLEKIARVQRQVKLRESINDAFKWGRLYGGAAAFIKIANQPNLELPLDLDTIMPDSFKGLFVVDRWSGVYPGNELIDDINDPDFGLPMYYEIRDNQGVARYRVHHSRVIRFTGRKLPFFEAITELYWGQSEIEAIYQDIQKKDNVSFNMASLTFKANLDVMAIDNLEQLTGLGGMEAQRRFWSVMQAQSVVQSNLGVRVVNKNDQFQQYQYNFAGLREVYEALLLDVAGASRIPATKLFGRSPQGMNATGKSDLKNYYEYCEQVREADFVPIVDRLLPIMAISCWGKIPDDLDAAYDPIETPSADELATLTQKKVDTLTVAFQNHAYDLTGYRKELKALNEQTGMFANITDEEVKDGEGIYYNDLQSMNDPFAGLENVGGPGELEEDPDSDIASNELEKETVE